jgi:hypothetical protein
MKPIKHYPYRTGMVRGISFPRESMRVVERLLYEQMGLKDFDNHVCFSFVDEYGNLGAIMFHDLVCIVGKSVEERKW